MAPLGMLQLPLMPVQVVEEGRASLRMRTQETVEE